MLVITVFYIMKILAKTDRMITNVYVSPSVLNITYYGKGDFFFGSIIPLQKLFLYCNVLSPHCTFPNTNTFKKETIVDGYEKAHVLDWVI